MSEELKPCPFCGQMPKVAREYHEKWTRDSESGKMILHVLPEFDDWVGCDNKECFIHYNQIEDPPVERLENWNTRPIEDALQARIADLEKENAALKNVPIPIEYWSDEKKEIYRRNESRSIKSGREA